MVDQTAGSSTQTGLQNALSGESEANTSTLTATTSPGGSFEQAGEPREGFSNHPQIAEERGEISETSSSFSDMAVGLASGFSAAISDRLGAVDFRGLADRATEMSGQVGALVQDFASDLPGKTRELGGRIDRHARANPWVHIGAVGVGALALGFLVGRSFAAKATNEETSV